MEKGKTEWAGKVGDVAVGDAILTSNGSDTGKLIDNSSPGILRVDNSAAAEGDTGPPPGAERSVGLSGERPGNKSSPPVVSATFCGGLPRRDCWKCSWLGPA